MLTFMKTSFFTPTILKHALFVGAFSLIGCAELNQPYGGYGGYGNAPYGGYNNGGYNNGGYNNGYGSYGNGYDYEQQRQQENLDRERQRLEEERRRLEWERNNQNHHRWDPPPYQQPNMSPPQVQPRQEQCPPGFSPSENKCSQAERQRGCKDMRLPGGLGCVHR